jgi:hypothetical protein
VKHNFLVKDVHDMAVTMKKAFYIANSGRPGPVVVDIPKDITAAKCKFEYPETIQMRSYNPVVKGHLGQIKKAVHLLLEAKRPMIYTGGGVILSNGAEQLTKLTRRLGFPITNTLMGLGAPIRRPTEQFLGMPGMHGTVEANLAMQHCDVLLAIGARFDDRVIGNPDNFSSLPRKIIHVDIDPSSISKRVKVDVPIVGNVPDVLEEMLKLLDAGNAGPDPEVLADWWKQIEEWRAKQCMKYRMKKSIIMPQYVIEKLYEVTGGKAIVTSDVGQHQMWAAQYYKFDNRVAGSTRAVWDDGCRPALRHGRGSGKSGDAGCLRHRRRLDPDVYSGAIDRQAVPSADQDHQPQQPLPGHGSPVAGDVLRQSLFGVVHGFAARLRQAGRSLWPRRHPRRKAGGRRGRAEARRSSTTRTIWYSSISSPIRRQMSFRWWRPAKVWPT